MYQTILDVSKRRGIIFPSFEIYGGVSGFFDYGPIGSRIKCNIEDAMRDIYLLEEGCLEVQCPTLTPEDVWVASGHVESFTDITTECLKCGEPYRADHLIEEKIKKSIEGKNVTEIQTLMDKHEVKCPKCGGSLNKAYDYNLMFQSFIGPGKNKITAYLRPETAQTTYLTFKRLWEIARKKLPIGVLQIGHSFRNEISPRQGMVRLREFNQAEIQYFVEPDKKETAKFKDVEAIKSKILTKDEKEFEMTLGDAVKKKIIPVQLIGYHLGLALRLFEEIGINPKKLKIRQHKDNERAFYSSDTWDVEYISDSFGRIELVGIADRADYDLKSHQKLSKKDMSVNIDGKKFIPHVVEIAYGIDRPFYCVLESCYTEENERVFFKFPKKIAPYVAAVFPLVNKDGLKEKAEEVFSMLKDRKIYSLYDQSGSIGRRYARADEIGISVCITIDYDTSKDNTVTVRKRDDTRQERVKIEKLEEYLTKDS